MGFRRLLVPEVVQSSGMDCGPAALKSFLEGHGISMSYGRLREACQTEVDGTSIETLEELASGLGAPVEQVLLPKDAILLEEAQALPAIAVLRLPNGSAHFAVVWSVAFGVAQVMDPAHGRRWLSREKLLEELYEHVMTVPAHEWRQWAGSEESLALLRRRLRDRGVSAETSSRLTSTAVADEGFQSFAALDAAIRGARREPDLLSLFEKARSDPSTIPKELWSVRPEPSKDAELVLRGAVLLRPAKPGVAPGEVSLPAAVAAARDEEPIHPLRELWERLRKDGLLAPGLLAATTLASATAVVLEGLFFRAFLEAPSLLLPLVLFLATALLLDLASFTGELRLGRRLEQGLRQAFQRKIPRLSDRYFGSRLISDMAERQHSLHQIRKVPRLGRQILREGVELLLTTAAILWLAPSTAPIVLTGLAALVASIGIPLLGQPILFERDSRVRSHLGGLSRFYLDSLLGLVPLRVHRAENALRSEHEALLASWGRARRGLQRAVLSLEAVQFALGYGLIVLLVFSYLRGGGDPASVLLLAYWALNLPVLGLQLVRLLSRYPEPRSVFLRIAEPLRAPEELDIAPSHGDSGQTPSSAAFAKLRRASPEPEGRRRVGAAIRLENVSVRAAGHRLLEGIDLEIAPGSHVAVVGSSGAGKTTFFGLFLGFHFPEKGRVLVDGSVLTGPRLADVRSQTAWVDPAVQLWNRSLEENLRYGNEEAHDLSPALAVLGPLSLPLETKLGEGGALVSGGEGQRVRLGRAFLRKGVRLALLDEPFRGLDRKTRKELLQRARLHWKEATLLAITHDVSECEDFDRVLVLEKGRLVEDGAPSELLDREGSRYRRLLEIEGDLSRLWSDGSWRSFRLENGRLVDA
jgi:ATP-binding cassette subfamily B protein